MHAARQPRSWLIFDVRQKAMHKIYTHYDNLKVARNAPIEVIAAAYRSLAQKYHPDKNPENANATRIMAILNASYEVLCDSQKRALHDQWIKQQEFVSEHSKRDPAKAASPRQEIVDRPYCAFVMKAKMLLALFVREVTFDSSKEEFAMVADTNGQVFLLLRIEIEGILRREAKLQVARKDGQIMRLSMPLSQLYAVHREKFDKFLWADCVRRLQGESSLSYPEVVFQPASFVSTPWD